MTIVVTGAAGHLGNNLVRLLCAQGAAVRALDCTRDWRSLAGLPIERVEVDVRDPAVLAEALAGADVVYHTAAVISLSRREWPLVHAVNVAGVRNLLAACRAAGVRRLVHFSSIHAYEQEPLHLPVDEERPLVSSPRLPPYDRSKAAGEREVRRAVEQGLDAVILNPTGMIGPYDYRPSFFGEVLLALGRGRLPVFVASGFDWVDVRDVAAAAIRAAASAPSGSRYLLSGHWVTMRQLSLLLQEITGRPAPRVFCPLWLAQVAAACYGACSAMPLAARGRPLLTSVSLQALHGNRRISHQRAARDLGYAPRPLRETLADTLEWFASHKQG